MRLKRNTISYFTTAVLQYAEENGISIGDSFGHGEDDFVVELYPYSTLIYRCVDELVKGPNFWVESALFDVVDNLTDCFWEIIEREQHEPMETSMSCQTCKDEFELDIKRSLAAFEA